MIEAAIFDGPGAPLRVARVARPVLAPGEALARVRLCTVCGSDLHTFTGRRKEKTPCVLGHEPVGEIVETNGDLRDVTGAPVGVGDRVVWAVAVSCGACFFCARGLPQKCESLHKYGHEAHTPRCGPLGGLASHCHLLAGTALVKVPADLPDAVAAPAGCAAATVAAVLRASGDTIRGLTPPARRCVVVFGLGMLGLTACAWLDALGADVIACDVSATRLAQATHFGARHLATPDALADLVRERTNGRGADAALELSGATDAAAAALAVLRVGGTAVWAGTVSPAPAVPVAPEAVVRKCLTLVGVHNYAPPDLAAAVTFLAAHHRRYPFAELVSKSFPLAAVNDAMHFAEAARPVRVAVTCS
jgi:alcohol dehydrogenase